MPKQRDPALEESRPIELRPLPGHPEYRNRPGRTGLDPFDNYREEGFFLGNIIASLLRGQALTRNPFWIGCMFLVGILLLGIGLLSFTVPPASAVVDQIAYVPLLLWFVVLGVIGFLCIVNAYMSIRDIVRGRVDSKEDGDSE